MEYVHKINLKIVLLTLLHLCLLLILKYSINDLSFQDFNIFIFGNVINILITLSILASLIILFLFPSKKQKVNYKFLLILVYLMTIPIAFLFFLNLFGISIPHGYIFGFPQKKIFYGLLFLTGLTFQLYLLQMVWGHIITTSSIIIARSFVSVIALLVSAIIITYSYSLIFASNGTAKNTIKKYDYGVVLGAAVWSNNKPSPIFEARIEKANEMFKAKRINQIQLTGSNAPGEISEAGAAFNMLRNYGVPKNNLRIEEKTSTTSEQIKFIKDNLVIGDGRKSVVIISDSFHLIRIREMCKFYGVEADVIASEYEISWEKYLIYSFRDSISLLLFWIFAI